MKHSLFLLWLSVGLSFGMKAWSQALRGVVTEAATGLPLEHAKVSIRQSFLETYTDPQGVFVLAPLPAGTYEVVVKARGFGTEKRTLRIVEGVDHLMSVPLRAGPSVEDSEIITSAQRSPQETWEVSETVRTLTAEQLQRIRPRSTPEALMDLPGLWIQKTYHGGGSAVVRGVAGNQTLLLIDGIRMNNSTCRTGPNPYLNTIDPWYMDRVEVVSGSGSVSYGSDALGGVIHLFTPAPLMADDGSFHTESEAILKYLSDDMERSIRANLQLSAGRLATHIGLSYKDFGDLLAGGDLGVQAPSAYTEINGDFKSIYQLSPRKRLTLAWQRVQQTGVGRYDQVAQGGYVRHELDPQERQLAYVRWESKGTQARQANWRATISAQQSIEGRINQQAGEAFETQERE
ncbi:MAG: TonB-dependent receptor plug domain-containing protein, partial [Bacteroidota bacterium]